MSIKGKPVSAPVPMLKNVGAAPVVYFDQVPVFGVSPGIVEIELAARMLMPRGDNTVFVDMGCTAHLRCSPNAAIVLIDALQKALDMLKKANEKPEGVLSN